LQARRPLPRDVGVEEVVLFTRHSLLAFLQLTRRTKEALAGLGEEYEAGASVFVVASVLTALSIVHIGLQAVVWPNRSATMPGVAVQVLVMVVLDWHACHIGSHIAWVALIAFACQVDRRRVRNPLSTAVLAEALCTFRAACEGIKFIALRPLDSLLTSFKVAFFSQEALIVLPEKHKAGTAILVTRPSAVLSIAHTSLEAIVWTKGRCTMVCVTVKMFMLMIAQHVDIVVTGQLRRRISHTGAIGGQWLQVRRGYVCIEKVALFSRDSFIALLQTTV